MMGLSSTGVEMLDQKEKPWGNVQYLKFEGYSGFRISTIGLTSPSWCRGVLNLDALIIHRGLFMNFPWFFKILTNRPHLFVLLLFLSSWILGNKENRMRKRFHFMEHPALLCGKQDRKQRWNSVLKVWLCWFEANRTKWCTFLLPNSWLFFMAHWIICQTKDRRQTIKRRPNLQCLALLPNSSCAISKADRALITSNRLPSLSISRRISSSTANSLSYS